MAIQDHLKDLPLEDTTTNRSSSDLEKGDGLKHNLQRQMSEPGAQPIQPIITEYEDVTYPEGGLEAWLVVLGSFSGMVNGNSYSRLTYTDSI